jgi:hypothetical protein
MSSGRSEPAQGLSEQLIPKDQTLNLSSSGLSHGYLAHDLASEGLPLPFGRVLPVSSADDARWAWCYHAPNVIPAEAGTQATI